VGASIGCLAVLWLTGCQSPPQFKSALDDNPIKPGDVLLVTSSANPEPFATKWVVDDAGNVSLPYASPWRVAGKKPSELAKELGLRFSVGRSVTFKIEKIGSDFFSPTPPTPSTAKSTPPKPHRHSSNAIFPGKRFDQ
jgi:hypothetical protein